MTYTPLIAGCSLGLMISASLSALSKHPEHVSIVWALCSIAVAILALVVAIMSPPRSPR